MKSQNQQHDDDVPVGRVLSRREALTLIAGVGTLAIGGYALLSPNNNSAEAASSRIPLPPFSTPTPVPTATTGTTPSCVVRPALTEGPYFVDERLNRSDIRSDPATGVIKAGATLVLTFNVSKISSGSCSSYSGAFVDLWHCDAAGLYSDESANNTVGQKFLRGYQATDANGQVTFTTIYPGWYAGRTAHLHFKIRSALTSTAYTFTSQLFFDDTLTDTVYSQAPYSGRGTRTTHNSNDNIYQSGGSQLLLNLTQTSGVYKANFDIGVQAS